MVESAKLRKLKKNIVVLASQAQATSYHYSPPLPMETDELTQSSTIAAD